MVLSPPDEEELAVVSFLQASIINGTDVALTNRFRINFARDCSMMIFILYVS